MENNDNWKKIYSLAVEIYRLSPWDYLEESDVFGIVMPETGKQYFVSVMGSAGSLEAIAAYEGTEALNVFWMLENSETADAGDILSIPHMILSFEKEGDIDEAQLKRFRALNNDPVFTDQFPEIRRVIPGLFPNEPDEQHLNDMVLILEQSLDVLKRAEKNSDFINPYEMEDDSYLMRQQLLNKEWADTYTPVEIKPWHIDYTWSQEDIDQVTFLPQSNAVLQAHYQLLPFHVKEENKPVFFPYALLLVNKKSSRIEGNEMLVADPDYPAMLGTIPKKYLDFIKGLGFRPRSVEVKNPVLMELLEEPMKLCGIRLVEFKHLPAMKEAIDGIMEYMRKNRG